MKARTVVHAAKAGFWTVFLAATSSAFAQVFDKLTTGLTSLETQLTTVALGICTVALIGGAIMKGLGNSDGQRVMMGSVVGYVIVGLAGAFLALFS